MKKKTLYIVPTPIGNIDDITIRSINILTSSDIIIVENIQHSLKLFNLLNINIKNKKFITYNINNEKYKSYNIVKKYKNKKISLISNAGTPGISDPGFLLIKEFIKQKINIDCLPGANAIIPSLIQSGAPINEFIFLGFLPKKKNRKSKIEYINKQKKTIILYESPYRLIKTLQEMKTILKQKKIIVCKELTKKFSETIRGSIDEIIFLLQNKMKIKGEFVIVIEHVKNKHLYDNI